PLAVRRAGRAGAYREPHRIPRPWPPVLRRYPVQPWLWPTVRRFARRHAGFPRPAVRPARRDPGLLRARVHAGQRRLRARGRSRQRGAAAPPRRGRHHASTRSPHPAFHPGPGARLQPVPAHRRARRARGAGGAPPGPRLGPGRGLRRTAAPERRSPRVRARTAAAMLLLLGSLAAPCRADGPDDAAATAAPEDARADPAPDGAASALPPGTRSGLDIYRDFRAGLAEPVCTPDASARWRAHFADAPQRLAEPASDVLPLFGFVVARLREAHLPTEFALIPFVESGFRPGARSRQGPAGLWQFIALTARNHKVPVQAGYDGRLSPVDSTEAAVRYLKTLHGMFAG